MVIHEMENVVDAQGAEIEKRGGRPPDMDG